MRPQSAVGGTSTLRTFYRLPDPAFIVQMNDVRCPPPSWWLLSLDLVRFDSCANANDYLTVSCVNELYGRSGRADRP
jgi:hypothetical protein